MGASRPRLPPPVRPRRLHSTTPQWHRDALDCAQPPRRKSRALRRRPASSASPARSLTHQKAPHQHATMSSAAAAAALSDSDSSDSDSDSSDAGDGASEYELLRRRHIKRNMEELRRLGLLSLKEEMQMSAAASGKTGNAAAAAAKKPRKKRVVVPPELLRRSRRTTGKEVEYTREKIDSLGDEMDKQRPTKKRRKAAAVEEDEEDDGDDEAAEASRIAISQQWLADSRAALAQLGLGGPVPSVPSEWRTEAATRWGDKVAGLKNVDDWEKYVVSRMSTPPPPSPLDLLQEHYAACPWRLLVACLLMSRVSSAKTKSKCMADFFKKFANPSAFMDADPSEVQPLIHSLGMFDQRFKALTAVTEAFLSMPEFDIGLEKKSKDGPGNKIFGCGPFTVDSYAIFCRNAGPGMTEKGLDPALAAFVRWQKSEE